MQWYSWLGAARGRRPASLCLAAAPSYPAIVITTSMRCAAFLPPRAETEQEEDAVAEFV
jgi:hypothetical protein